MSILELEKKQELSEAVRYKMGMVVDSIGDRERDRHTQA